MSEQCGCGAGHGYGSSNPDVAVTSSGDVSTCCGGICRTVEIEGASTASQTEGLWFSDRGFAQFDDIPSDCGGFIRAYESSSAEGAYIWVRTACPKDLNDPEGPTIEAVVHLEMSDAIKLWNQLGWLINNHYQNG